MSVKERLKIYIKHSDLSNKAFEISINVSNGYINNISKSIGIEILEKIVEKYSNLNLDWLISGRGEMLRNAEEKKEELYEKDNKYIASLEKNIEFLEEKLQQCQDQKKFIENSKTNV